MKTENWGGNNTLFIKYLLIFNQIYYMLQYYNMTYNSYEWLSVHF